MNVSVGTDIIEVDRIKNAMKDENFKNRVFTENEILYCEAKNEDIKFQHYAARFAGKEAVFKAVSQYLNNKYSINWLDVEIINNEQGRPSAIINGNKLENIKLDISLSHIKEVAIATAIAYMDK